MKTVSKILNDWQWVWGVGKSVSRFDPPGRRAFFRDTTGLHWGLPDPNSNRQYDLQFWFLPGAGLLTEHPRRIGGSRWYQFRGWNRHTLKRLTAAGHGDLRVRLGDRFRGISADELREGMDKANAHSRYRRDVFLVARKCLLVVEDDE